MATIVEKSIGRGVAATGAGTVAVTNGSKSVVGTGTSFTTDFASLPRAILINGVAYTVASVEDDTHLTLFTNYEGNSGSGLSYAIGTRDFGRVFDWHLACPLDLVADDLIWKGLVYNDDGQPVYGRAVIGRGVVCDADHYQWLTAAPGHSFIDQAEPVLRYDPARGATLYYDSPYYSTIEFQGGGSTYTRIDRLQIGAVSKMAVDHHNWYPAGVVVENCILLGGTEGYATSVGSNGTYRNCLIISRTKSNIALGGGLYSFGHSKVFNCTVVRPTDLDPPPPTHVGIGFSYPNSNTLVRNCAVFGFPKVMAGETFNNGRDYTLVERIHSDAAAPAIYKTFVSGLSYADQFVDPTLNGDFRLKETAATLFGRSKTEDGITTDILGTTRKGRNDIGCHVYTGPVTVANVNTIGTAKHRDYFYLNDWYTDLAPDLTAINRIAKIEAYNDGGFIQYRPNFDWLKIEGITTDATRYLHLTAAPGHSFMDHPDAARVPLRLMSQRGATFLTRLGWAVQALEITVPYTKVERLQFKHIYSDANSVITLNATNCLLKGCIVYRPSTNGVEGLVRVYGVGTRAVNVITISDKTGNEVHFAPGNDAECINCAAIRTSATRSTTPAYYIYAQQVRVKNCIAVGFTRATDTGLVAGYGWNAVDRPAVTQDGPNVVEFDSAETFYSLARFYVDLRVKPGSPLIGAGTPDSATGGKDILGRPRSAEAPTIGPFEYIEETIEDEPGFVGHPIQPEFADRRKVPTGRVRINWAHPLARGINACFVWQDGRMVDLANPSRRIYPAYPGAGTPVQGGIRSRPGTYGVGAYFGPPDGDTYNGPYFTFDPPLDVSTSAPNGKSEFHVLNEVRVSGTYVPFWGQYGLVFFFQNGAHRPAHYASASVRDIGSPITQGDPYTVGAWADTGHRNSQIFLNGKLDAAQSSGVHYSSLGPVSTFGWQSGQGSSSCNYVMSVHWTDRRLTEREFQQLHDDPFCFLEPEVDDFMWFEVGEGGGGPSLVSTLATLKWDVRQLVGKSGELRWSLLQLLSLSRDLRWSIRSLTSSSADLRWDIRESIANDADLRWRITNLVSASRELEWDIRELISSDVEASWIVLQLATKAQELSWDLRQLVGALLDMPWDIQGQPGVVSRRSTLVWDLKQLTSKVQDLRWDIRIQILKSSDLRWSIRERVINSADLRWSLKMQLVRSSDLRWGIRALVEKTGDLQWGIKNGVSIDLETAWAIKSLVVADLAPKWNIRQQVTQGETMLWNLISRIEKTSGLSWDVRNQVLADLKSLWDIRQQVLKDESLPWHIRQLIAKKLTSVWEVNGELILDTNPLTVINVPFDDYEIGVPFEDSEIMIEV